MNALTAMKQALEALETCDDGDYSTGHVIPPSFDNVLIDSAIANLRTAISEMERAEPVAWIDNSGNVCFAEYVPAATKLFTHPQDRDSIIEECAAVCKLGEDQSEYARYYITQILALKWKK